MSAVTKIFVVLLVVLTIFMAAAQIVYVNKSEDFKAMADKAKAAADTAQRQAGDSNAQLTALQARVASGDAMHTAQEVALMDTITKKDQANAQLQLELASAQSGQIQSQATAAANAAALQTAQTELAKVQDLLADARKNTDDMRAKVAAQATEADAAGNTIDSLTQENKRLQLEVSDLNKQLAAQASAMQHPTNPDGSQSPTFIPSTLPKVVGVIREKAAVGPKMYAEISVGSRDAIQKGMQLTVVQNGTFVGYLTVDSVDTDSSFGQLSGPKLDLIQPNKTEVYTRLN